MSNFEELKILLIKRIYENSQDPKGEKRLTEEHIVGLLSDKTTVGIATDVMTELFKNGLIQQTRGYPIAFEATDRLVSIINEDSEIETEIIEKPTDLEETSNLFFREFRDKMILSLYKKSNAEGFKPYSLENIANEYNLTYASGWIREVERFLDDGNYALVPKSFGNESVCEAQLNAYGMEYAENYLDSITASFNSETIENVDMRSGANTNDWSPLPIDRSLLEYKTLETAIENLFERLRGDNGYKESEPDEQEAMEATLSTGLEQLKKSNITTKHLVQSLIHRPAQYLSKKFADNAIGALAKTVVTKLLAWLATF